MVILTSFPPPTEGVRLQQANTEVSVGSRRFGTGTLYISESRLSWVGNNGFGFSLEYPAISVHAVSRDHRAYPQECLYMMIDEKLDETTADSQEIEEDDDITEIRFIPEDKGVLDALFHALSDCQALHPDPEESLYSTDEDECISEQVRHIDSHENGNMQHANDECEEEMDTGQFEDA